MGYSVINLFEGLHKNDYLSLNDFIDYIKYDYSNITTKWTHFNNEVYVSYPLLQVRFIEDGDIKYSYIYREEFIKKVRILFRKQKINKILNEL